MSDKKNPTGMGRREALLWLLGGSFQLGLLASAAGAQLTRPRNLRIVHALSAGADSPIARNLHPRTFVTPTMVNSLRSQLATDAAFRARWQTAVNQFEAGGGTWASSATQADPKKVDSYATAFAAFLTCVRRPDNDLGLTWKSSWETYRSRIVSAANGWHHDGITYPPHAIALALIYDFLHTDLNAQERSEFVKWITTAADKGSWVVAVHHWDNNETDQHIAKLFSSLVLDDALARFATAYQETVDWAESRNWFGYATGMGYEWKNSHPSVIGLCTSLLAVKNAGGLTEAETTDRILIHLRDGWQSVRQFVIPHPSSVVRPADYWNNDRTNMTAPAGTIYHRGLNVGAHMLWALALLPGKVQLKDAVSYSDQPTLANSEADYFGYLQHVWDEPTPTTTDRRLRNIVDLTHVSTGSPTPIRSGVYGFYAFPAWLILNAQERPPIDPVTARIPKVRRWWPGVLDWTTILSGFSHAQGSLISYHHRKWWMSQYEEGCRQNGSWHVHRDGPLLIQRGSASHGSISRKATWGANGTVSFVDHKLYPVFTRPNQDEDDAGNIRIGGGSRKSKAGILADAKITNYGDVTQWYADAQVVAISSDLVRSYNSTVVQYGNPATNAPKISAFTREFVCIQRGADGTDHEHVFTYDRIRLLDTRFEPRYNLCPATNPNIDGTERANEPWAPSAGEWTAVGPTRWDYTGATRMIYDNVAEPKAPRPGNGKVCVTWLQPSGTGVRIQKLGGTKARSAKEPQANGAPGINPWNGWIGLDGEWNKFDDMEVRAYTGLYSVAVIPTSVSLDTRFLIACDVMAANDQPGTSESLSCDPQSVAARCGASAVVFSNNEGGRSAGSVLIPASVKLVVLANLPPTQNRTLVAGGGLTITTTNRMASNTGVLVVTVNGAGTLQFS